MVVPSEHEEQVKFVAWFRREYPDVVIFAIPNGGARNKVTAVKLKAEGVTRGVPDLFIPEWRLFIEMKRQKGGNVSQEQKNMIDYLSGCGYKCLICKGFDDAVTQLSTNT